MQKREDEITELDSEVKNVDIEDKELKKGKVGRI